MALEPITRQEKIIAGQDLTPITRMEMFLKNFGGGGGSVPAAGGVTTLHINVTAINKETMEATFTADKTPAEINQAAISGPVWCVVSFPAGILAEEAVSLGVSPTLYGLDIAFGCVQAFVHNENGNNIIFYIVRPVGTDTWFLDLNAFGS